MAMRVTDVTKVWGCILQLSVTSCSGGEASTMWYFGGHLKYLFKVLLVHFQLILSFPQIHENLRDCLKSAPSLGRNLFLDLPHCVYFKTSVSWRLPF